MIWGLKEGSWSAGQCRPQLPWKTIALGLCMEPCVGWDQSLRLICLQAVASSKNVGQERPDPEAQTGFQTWKMLLLTRCLCTTHKAWLWFWQMKMSQIELSEILLWTSVHLSSFCLGRIKHVLNSLCVLKRTQHLWSTQTPKSHGRIIILTLEQSPKHYPLHSG